mgnify:CR=1 FL=1
MAGDCRRPGLSREGGLHVVPGPELEGGGVRSLEEDRVEVDPVDLDPNFLLKMGNYRTPGVAAKINLALVVQVIGFCEGVALAERAGVSRESAVEAMLNSVVSSPVDVVKRSILSAGHVGPMLNACDTMRAPGRSWRVSNGRSFTLPDART